MLTLYDFNGMDEKGQADAVFTEEVYVDDRDEGGLKVQLYRLGSFYVEVFYDPVGNKISRLRSFKSSGQLAPYVKLS
ncbi:MAG TPA: hypothetical protein VFE53_24080 [Mucilaginibacter sp.]|jgi:hypothetical protein|nr:hypothetical protein [Mucilaginibacter sp.]